MVPPLDVFAFDDGEPQWLGCAETLASALELARKNGTGRYFVFSHQTGHKTMYAVDPQGRIKPITSLQEKIDG
jgi:hypothetical protein